MKKKAIAFLQSMAVSVAAVLLTPAVSQAAENPGAPVQLADTELDQVKGGDGSLLDLPMNINILLKDISVVVNVSNVPLNAAAAVQVNALGTAEQTAQVEALQSVTQLQSLMPNH